jgi:hypothetical protein
LLQPPRFGEASHERDTGHLPARSSRNPERIHPLSTGTAEGEGERN